MSLESEIMDVVERYAKTEDFKRRMEDFLMENDGAGLHWHMPYLIEPEHNTPPTKTPMHRNDPLDISILLHDFEDSTHGEHTEVFRENLRQELFDMMDLINNPRTEKFNKDIEVVVDDLELLVAEMRVKLTEARHELQG